MLTKNHPQGVHVCTECNISSKRLYNLERHVKHKHGIVSKDVCRYCAPKEIKEVPDIDDDDDDDDGGHDNDESPEDSDSEDGEADSDSEEEHSDSEEDVEEEEDEEDTSLWKEFKRKVLKNNPDTTNIVKDVIQLYLDNVEFKLMLEKDKLHKKLKRVMVKKIKGMDEKSAFDRTWREYRPAIEKAVFDLCKHTALTKTEKIERNKGTIFEHELESDDCSSQLWHDYLLSQISEDDAAELYADVEKRKEVMKEVKQLYLKALYRSNDLDKDHIHRLIRQSTKNMLKNEDMDENEEDENDMHEKEAYYASAIERLGMIKQAISGEEEEEDNDSLDSTSSTSSSDSDDDSTDNDGTFFVDLFDMVIAETFPDEDPHDILNDEAKMDIAVDHVIRKYRKLIKLKNKMERSETHRTIERTKNKLEAATEDSDSDDEDWIQIEKWGDAIKVRKLAILKNIKNNYPDEAMETDEDESVDNNQEKTGTKRRREEDNDDDDERSPKKLKGADALVYNYYARNSYPVNPV